MQPEWQDKMAGSLNKASIIGRLGKDPESRTFQNGNSVCNLSVATSESWKDKATGERKERTEWHRVNIFNEHLAKIAQQYLKKGDVVYLEGTIETRKYEFYAGVPSVAWRHLRSHLVGSLGFGTDC